MFNRAMDDSAHRYTLRRGVAKHKRFLDKKFTKTLQDFTVVYLAQPIAD